METDVLENTSLESAEVPFELETLSRAVNYQHWVCDFVKPFIGHRVLEIGAGIGNMSIILPLAERLVLSEADPYLLGSLKSRVAARHGEDPRVTVHRVDLTSNWVEELVTENFDTIVSFNVLEHIEDDYSALAKLLEILKRSKASGPKRLVTFVPAHPWAFGSIDESFGHFRRYSHKDFRTLMAKLPYAAKLEYQYFNLFGLPSWFLCNRILKKKAIGKSSIETFDRIVPFIRGMDNFLHQKLRLPFGQSICAIITVE
jgi:SAM-dependent methyltransferase